MNPKRIPPPNTLSLAFQGSDLSQANSLLELATLSHPDTPLSIHEALHKPLDKLSRNHHSIPDNLEDKLADVIIIHRLSCGE